MKLYHKYLKIHILPLKFNNDLCSVTIDVIPKGIEKSD